MKGAFETALVLMFGMLFVVMGLDYVTVVFNNNQARMLTENTLAILEHQNRYDENVQSLIDQSPLKCEVCTLTLQTHETYSSRIWVIVQYPIQFNHLNFQAQSEIRLLSRPLG